jgi:hypothetical protein
MRTIIFVLYLNNFIFNIMCKNIYYICTYICNLIFYITDIHWTSQQMKYLKYMKLNIID